MASDTLMPRTISPRASGTLPHSQTGNSTPSRESVARRSTGTRGRIANSSRCGNQICTTTDNPMPSITKGSDSMITLIERVRRSCRASPRSSSVGAVIRTAKSTASTARAYPSRRGPRTGAAVGSVPRGAGCAPTLPSVTWTG